MLPVSNFLTTEKLTQLHKNLDTGMPLGIALVISSMALHIMQPLTYNL